MTTPNHGSQAADPVNDERDTQASTTAVQVAEPLPGPVIYLIQTPPTGAPSATAAGAGNRATRRTPSRTRNARGPREVIDLDAFVAGLPAPDDDLGELDDIAPPTFTAPTAAPAAALTQDTTTGNDQGTAGVTAAGDPAESNPSNGRRRASTSSRGRTGTLTVTGWQPDEEMLLAEVRHDLDADLRGMRGIQGANYNVALLEELIRHRPDFRFGLAAVKSKMQRMIDRYKQLREITAGDATATGGPSDHAPPSATVSVPIQSPTRAGPPTRVRGLRGPLLPPATSSTTGVSDIGGLGDTSISAELVQGIEASLERVIDRGVDRLLRHTRELARSLRDEKASKKQKDNSEGDRDDAQE
ncbi:unnamed protein product [Closterium sp. Naga37s-1]|nr:unnamed protein product [Closterium sp. Naga37s-1]CAI5525280.1 unnamed protein product [Closterium sp. Naga37s-1]